MTLDGMALLDALPKPSAVVTSEGRVVAANQLFSRLFGRTSGAQADPTAALVTHPALHGSVREAVAALASGARSTEFRWTGPSPDALEFVGHASRAGEDQFMLVFDHVSDQVESEQIFGVIREYLDGVLNQLPLGLIVLNGDRRVTFYNRSQGYLFEELGLDLSMLEVVGARVDECYPVFPGDEWKAFVEAVTGQREPISRAKVGYPRTNPAHYLQIQLLPLTARQGHVSGAICITQDVTRLVHLEEDLVRQERLAVAGQLVAKFHHEINNPLVSILGLAEMLLYRTPLEDEVARRVKRIRRGALRIAEVTKKMREIRELGKKEWPERLPVLPDLSIHPSAQGTSGR